MRQEDPPHGCGRRRFLGTVGGAAAGLAIGACNEETPDIYLPHPGAMAPRRGRANPFLTDDGRPVLVSVRAPGSQGSQEFEAMLARGLEALGGCGRLLGPGDDVLLKPNLGAPEGYPGTSSPDSIAALVRHLRTVTSGLVSVGDEGWRPGPEVYAHLDLLPTVAAAGGVLTTFDSTYRVWGVDWSDERPDFYVYSAVQDAPVIVNLCTLKRHDVAGYSCAIKNNVGAVAGPSYASTRGYLHDPSTDFLGAVAEIAACVRPELNIVDARSVLTQRGPFLSWGGVPVEANRLILCGDMVATDAYCVQLLEALDQSFTDLATDSLIQRAAALHLGEPDLDRVRIVEIGL